MRIYTQDLGPDITEIDLKEVFQLYGKVSFVRINVEEGPDGVDPVRSAIIGMQNKMESLAAIVGLHGKTLKGTLLKVREAGVGISNSQERSG